MSSGDSAQCRDGFGPATSPPGVFAPIWRRMQSAGRRAQRAAPGPADVRRRTRDRSRARAARIGGRHPGAGAGAVGIRTDSADAVAGPSRRQRYHPGDAGRRRDRSDRPDPRTGPDHAGDRRPAWWPVDPCRNPAGPASDRSCFGLRSRGRRRLRAGTGAGPCVWRARPCATTGSGILVHRRGKPDVRRRRPR